MKQIIFLLLFALALPLAGQVELPKPREVDKDYRPEYRHAVKEYNQNEKRISEQWDVFLGPGESIPTDVISTEEFRAQAGYSNWFADLVRPESVAADMLRGANRKGIINIMDTGCSTDHPDLKKGLVPGSNYTGDPCPDIHGHATHVLGISYLICKPLIDAGWIDVKMSKFLGDKGQGSFGAITGGEIEETSYMVDNYIAYGKFAIANNSWGGGTSTYAPLAEALQKGKDAGIAYFFAAGNSGGPVIFPGSLPQVSAVSSLDQNLTISSFSSRGPEVDFAAGGRNIYSTYPGGNYASLSGTSMASPAMAGLGAVAMCLHPSLTAETLPGYLAEIAQDLGEPGKDDLYGWGLAFARKIIDTPPDGEPEPDPPTCTDGKQNGKETGVDCGGPDCPACDPEPDKPPYQPRDLKIYLNGAWVLGWWNNENRETLGLKQGQVMDGITSLYTDGAACYDLDAPALINPSGMTYFKISRIGFISKSKTTYDWDYQTLKENADRFYQNRAISGSGNRDGRDMGQFILFFLDYYAANKPEYKGQDLVPIYVEFQYNDGNGDVKVILEGDELIDYKKK